jgi:hypothetical protein
MRFTELIGAHVVHAFSHGQTPIMVSNAVNAFSTNWQKIQTYMKLVHKAFLFVIRLPAISYISINTESMAD